METKRVNDRRMSLPVAGEGATGMATCRLGCRKAVTAVTVNILIVIRKERKKIRLDTYACSPEDLDDRLGSVASGVDSSPQFAVKDNRL